MSEVEAGTCKSELAAASRARHETRPEPAGCDASGLRCAALTTKAAPPLSTSPTSLLFTQEQHHSPQSCRYASPLYPFPPIPLHTIQTPAFPFNPSPSAPSSPPNHHLTHTPTGLQQHIQPGLLTPNIHQHRKLSPPPTAHPRPRSSLHPPTRRLAARTPLPRTRLRELRCAGRGAESVPGEHILSQL